MVLLDVRCFAKIFCSSYFITHIKWDVIISSLLRLLLKVWIWYRCQNRIENCYHHDGEELDFTKKYIWKHRVGCSGNLYCKKQRIPIYLIKAVLTRTSNTIFKHEESWHES